MGTAAVWDFELRAVSFSVSLSASFHPSVGGLSVTIPWLDAAGALSSSATFGPLSACEADDRRPARGCQAGAKTVRARKDLGSLPVTLALVQAIRAARLPVRVQLAGPSGAVEVPSSARLHLGPLLLAGGGAGEAGSQAADAQGTHRPAWPSEVSAVGTESIGVAGLYSLDLHLSTDVPLLSRPMLERLMPACFTVEAVRGLPNEGWLPEKCQDMYVEVYPQLSRATACLAEEFPAVRSAGLPHDAAAHFSEPVVWFLGFAPPHVVREWLQHEGLVVEIHDRDLRSAAPTGGEGVGTGMTETESKATLQELQATLDRQGDGGKRKQHPHGVARFQFGPLLQSRSLKVALRSGVLPGRSDKKRRRAEALKEGLRAEGILEEEGAERIAQRAGFEKREDTTDYHACGTVCTLRAALAVPLPAAGAVCTLDEGQLRGQWAASEQRHGEDGNIWVATSAAEGSAAPAVANAPRKPPFRAKVRLPDGAEVAGPWRSCAEEAEADERELLQPLAAGQGEEAAAAAVRAVAQELAQAPTPAGLDCRYERFGRIVLVVDEADSETIRAVLQKVLTSNAQLKGMQAHSAEVDTYQLTDEEKTDPHLDLLTGFAVLDGKSRIFVIEGLRERGLQALAQVVSGRPNSTQFKLLHNPSIGFSERLYAEFGSLKLKQIKIRQPLERLAAKPDLYSVSGVVSDDTVAGTQAVKLLMELKQMSRLRALRQGAAFPKSVHLANLEILYGGYVTDAELEGRPTTTTGSSAATKGRQETGSAEVEGQLLAGEAAQTLKLRSLRGLEGVGGRAPRAALDMQNAGFSETLQLRASASLPDFRKTNRELVQQQSAENMRINDLLGKKRSRQTPFLDGQQVYTYSGQKMNSAELQKEWMRKHMDVEEGNKLWTYSAAYTSQTFEFSGAPAPGVTQHVPRCASDTYARIEGDDRPVWRDPPARPKEAFRRPERDVGAARASELHEAFVEHEWQTLPMGEERHKPVAVHVRFEPDKIPHHREVTERPFDASRMQPGARDFGPKAGFESVHYHGRMPGEHRSAEAERHNVREREKAKVKILAGSHMRSFSQGATRSCVGDADRCEHILKDAPAHKLRGRVDDPMPVTIRTLEEHHEVGQPAREWHARLRENDSSPPYDVLTGTYLKRDPEVGTGSKRACMSGSLTKAPWRHGAEQEANGHGASSAKYPAAQDFNATRQPPRSRACESQVWKSASRSAIHEEERMALPYRRPAHYGVQLLP